MSSSALYSQTPPTFPQCDRPSHTPTQNTRQNNGSVHFRYHVL